MLTSLSTAVQDWIGPKLYLKYKEDTRTLFFVASYFALFWYLWLAYPGVVSSGWTSAYALAHIPAWMVLCFLSFLGAVATHNCIHCPMFTRKPLNRAFQITLSLVYGHPVTSYVPGHNLSHHKYTQGLKDVMRTTKLQYKWHLLNGLLFFAHIGIGMVANDAAYFRVQKRLGRPIVKQLELEQAILWSLALLFAVWDWRRWLLIAFLPHLFAKFCIISLNLLQHDGCDAYSKINFSRNFTGTWLNYFCYNNGYHTIHHLHPGMHWSLLPHRHEKDIAPTIAPLLDQEHILTYCYRTFIWPGVRVDWEGNPWQPPPMEKDEPWFMEDTETFSNGEHN